jgi:hypothetical protein
MIGTVRSPFDAFSIAFMPSASFSTFTYFTSNFFFA